MNALSQHVNLLADVPFGLFFVTLYDFQKLKKKRGGGCRTSASPKFFCHGLLPFRLSLASLSENAATSC